MLYIEFTKKCNSRCITCSYWKTQIEDRIIQENDIIAFIQNLPDLEVILFTGGEAMLYESELFELAEKIRNLFPNIDLRLLTNGLKIGKYVDEICTLFDVVVFSFDGSNAITYEKIRGIDAFELVTSAVKKVHLKGTKIRFRCMILEINANELFEIVKLAFDLGVNQISFLPVDSSSETGFGRNNGIGENYQIKSTELVINELKKILNVQEWQETGLLPKNGQNIKEMISFFTGTLRQSICNAPDSSIVLEMNGNVKGCFFRPSIGNICNSPIDLILTSSKFVCEKNNGKHRCLPECRDCIL